NAVSNIWSASYKGIGRCNTILANLNKMKFNDVDFKNEVQGNAKFLRALYYFNLVRIFGGVPLITTQIKSIADTQVSRANMKKVYSRIKSDLSDAISLLPSSYSGNNYFKIGMA